MIYGHLNPVNAGYQYFRAESRENIFFLILNKNIIKTAQEGRLYYI